MKAWVFLALLVVAAASEAENAASTEPEATEEFAERAVFEVGHTPGGCTFLTVLINSRAQESWATSAGLTRVDCTCLGCNNPRRLERV